MAENRGVLLACGALEPGGIQSLLLGVAERLVARGWQVDFATMSEETGSWTMRAEALGCRVHALGNGRNPIALTSRLRQVVQGQNYRAIHVNRSSHAMAPLLVAARGLRIPIRIAHYHNIPPRGLRAVASPILRHLVLRSASHLVGVSSEVMEQQFGLGWRHLGGTRVLPNAIDTDTYRPGDPVLPVHHGLKLPKDAVILGHSGRFGDAKNQEFLVKLMPTILRKIPGAVLLMAGDGPRLATIRKMARQLGVEKNIHFLGWVNDMPSFYQSIDLFLFPSRWEGFGLVLAEAQACGKPCIASPLRCFDEVLCPSNRRLMADLESPGGWLRRITLLTENKDLYQHVSREGLEFSRRFSMDVLVTRLERIYSGGRIPTR